MKVTRAVRKDLDPEKKVEAEKVIFVEPSLNGILPTAMAFKELERSVSRTIHFVHSDMLCTSL